MGNTIAGGEKAAATNVRLYGEDWYKRIGALGGKAPKTKPSGFAAMDKEKVRAAGVKGGKISKRVYKSDTL